MILLIRLAEIKETINFRLNTKHTKLFWHLNHLFVEEVTCMIYDEDFLIKY